MISAKEMFEEMNKIVEDFYTEIDVIIEKIKEENK